MKPASVAAADYFNILLRSRPIFHNKFQFLRSSSSPQSEDDQEQPPLPTPPSPEDFKDAEEVFRRWRFSDGDISYLRSRRPSLLRISPSLLHPKLLLLSSLHLRSPSDLLRLVSLRPRLLHLSLPPPSPSPPPPLLRSLFPSPPLLRRALLRNPSLLTAPLLPTLSLYASLGVPPRSLAPLLLSRPTLLLRSDLSPDKLRLVRLAGLDPSSPLYKYALAVVAVSKLSTILSKISNLERFGFSQHDVLSRLFARSPYLLTLSVDKVQRNMTYITAIMKLPADTVLLEPQLLHYSLEAVLKPRYMVLVRLREMGLQPEIEEVNEVLKAMRMKEERFIRAFISCHKEDGVAEGLLDFYNEVKRSKRLADSARKVVHKGFPY